MFCLSHGTYESSPFQSGEPERAWRPGRAGPGTRARQRPGAGTWPRGRSPQPGGTGQAAGPLHGGHQVDAGQGAGQLHESGGVNAGRLTQVEKWRELFLLINFLTHCMC